MSRCFLLFIVISAAFIVDVSCNRDVDNAVDDVTSLKDDVTSLKDGSKYCPVILIGTKCASPSIFHYYECCGDLLNECCFNLQVWVIVVLAVIAVLLLASCVMSFIRCICCGR